MFELTKQAIQYKKAEKQLEKTKIEEKNKQAMVGVLRKECLKKLEKQFENPNVKYVVISCHPDYIQEFVQALKSLNELFDIYTQGKSEFKIAQKVLEV